MRAPGDEDVAVAVHGQPLGKIVIGASDHRGIDQFRALGIHLGDENVIRPPAVW